jgi:uncharacterized protein (TIGR03435 family)
MTRTALLPIVILAGSIVPAAVLFGQTPVARPAFEVASVKRQTDVVPGMTFSARGATLTVVNNELANVIDNAYGIRRYQLVGAPDWVDSDRYDIQAKAAGDATRDELMVMVQSLLAERFKLKVHHETREMPIYALMVSKGGFKLRPAVEGSCVVIDPRNLPRPAAPGQPRLPGCGNNLIRTNSWNATAIDMKGAAAALVGVLGRSVVDRTGVEGKFDIKIEWTPDQAPAGADGAAASNAAGGLSLFTVLEDQLGLKVESARGPVDVLVIDHVERPTDD